MPALWRRKPRHREVKSCPRSASWSRSDHPQRRHQEVLTARRRGLTAAHAGSADARQPGLQVSGWAVEGLSQEQGWEGRQNRAAGEGRGDTSIRRRPRTQHHRPLAPRTDQTRAGGLSQGKEPPPPQTGVAGGLPWLEDGWAQPSWWETLPLAGDLWVTGLEPSVWGGIRAHGQPYHEDPPPHLMPPP